MTTTMMLIAMVGLIGYWLKPLSDMQTDHVATASANAHQMGTPANEQDINRRSENNDTEEWIQQNQQHHYHTHDMQNGNDSERD